MSLNRRAAARDQNEPEIIAAFEGRYWRVVQHTKYDLDASCPRCKGILAIEVKVPQDEKATTSTLKRTHGGRLTESQQKLIDSGWPLRVVRSAQDVTNLVVEHDKRCLR